MLLLRRNAWSVLLVADRTSSMFLAEQIATLGRARFYSGVYTPSSIYPLEQNVYLICYTPNTLQRKCKTWKQRENVGHEIQPHHQRKKTEKMKKS